MHERISQCLVLINKNIVSLCTLSVIVPLNGLYCIFSFKKLHCYYFFASVSFFILFGSDYFFTENSSLKTRLFLKSSHFRNIYWKKSLLKIIEYVIFGKKQHFLGKPFLVNNGIPREKQHFLWKKRFSWKLNHSD